MDTLAWLLLLLTGTMFAVTWHAHRIGNERRDVALLGAIAGLLVASTAASAIF